MNYKTVSVALPVALLRYAEQRVPSGGFGTMDAYLHDLIRRDQEEHSKKRLRQLLEEGLNSGSGRKLTQARAAELKARAQEGQS